MRRSIVLLLAAAVTACATSPLGRPQLKLFPEAELAQMGAASYAEIKKETKTSSDASVNRYVRCIANAITAQTGGNWEVTVFADDQANAFALPGGKIGVYTGLLDVAENQDQLAAVMAHEVAHVLADHGNERVSTSFAAQSGLELVSAVSGAGQSATGQKVMSLLGLGTQVGVLLPFSRAQESEADILGLQLMARSGFRPEASVALWRNMAERSEGQPPEFLSTHPSHGSRIGALQENMPKARQLYEQARGAGRTPSCG
ncbi:peptidase M48 Ste24p [Salinisphaera sp. PC39]|uniref:M48 family metallopeptidase n=1 Tax=Salinisphaera sp. PC39 TaxID=1304156 RepID=UPI0033422523